MMIFGCLNARDWPRYFDRHKDDGTIILTICYPTLYAINSIIGLRDHGLMPAENIRVIGIFHEDESSDYEAGISWAETNNIDWIDFHRVEGTLHKDNLWQEIPALMILNLFLNIRTALFYSEERTSPPHCMVTKHSF